MICYDVDTALAEVPVNTVPLIDDGDFKSTEESVAYNASGMSLKWHFKTPGGAWTVTDVTPTSGGTYDWAHQGHGMYSIEIPASGGASINNDTEGFGYFTGKITGVLPFRGPTLCFRAAALNDALIEGGDNLDVNTVQFGGTNGTFSGGRPEVNTTHAAGTAWGSGAITAASVAADAVTEIQTGLATSAEITTLSGKVDTVDDFLDTEVAAILAAVDTEVAAIKAKTDQLTFTTANQVDATTVTVSTGAIGTGDIASAALNEIADAVLDRNMATGTDSGSTTVRTPRQALRLLRNARSISAGTLSVKKEDDSTNSWTAAVTTAAGDPIDSVDPAGP